MKIRKKAVGVRWSRYRRRNRRKRRRVSNITAVETPESTSFFIPTATDMPACREVPNRGKWEIAGKGITQEKKEPVSL